MILVLMKLFCILIVSVSVSTYDNTVLQNITIGRNWFNGAWVLSVLFLTIACDNPQISQNKKLKIYETN